MVDELLALARVFFYAGASGVAATLWKVDDATSADFVDFFYKHWLHDGEPLPVAFQKAIVAIMADNPNPCFWAPYVFHGNWQVTEARPIQPED